MVKHQESISSAFFWPFRSMKVILLNYNFPVGLFFKKLILIVNRFLEQMVLSNS